MRARLKRPRTPFAATVDIAGIACRITSNYVKPVYWAEAAPAFRPVRRPAMRVHVEYGRRQGRLPWIAPATVEDRPEIVAHRGFIEVRTAYYVATIRLGGRDVVVRMQAGFGVGGLMHTLYAWWLLRRRGFLVRAHREERGGASWLVMPPDRGEATNGGTEIFAVRRTRTGWVSHATPFGVAGAPAANTAMPVRGLRVGMSTDAPVSPATAACALARHITVVDRQRHAVSRLLALLADFVQDVWCVQEGAVAVR